MGTSGPKPKEGAVRPNQGGRTVFSVPAEGNDGDYPELEGRHAIETERWYETWATSPQATKFITSDWQRLQQLAYVVDELYTPTMVTTPHGERREQSVTSVMAEIRQNEKLLGATLLDRASLYMTVEPKKAPESAESAENGPPALASVSTLQQSMRITG